MVAEPTGPTLDVSPSRGPWAPGGDPWSQFSNGPGNSTSGTDGDQAFRHIDNILSLLMVLISLCGSAGNGAVVWLLGFRLKRSPFSVYILNLACADGIFLLSTGVWVTLTLLHHGIREVGVVVLRVWATTHLAGLGLLMAISTERCISALCPIWYRCRRPAHLSCTVCALIWGLALCVAIYEGLCSVVVIPCDGLGWVYSVTVVITFLVLCVSSLTLLVRVQCGSRGTRPSRLYVTILLTVLAFLLLGLPYNVFFLVLTVSPRTVQIPALSYIVCLLSLLNCAVNPIIYFFMGRYRQRQGRTSLREVLQRALRDDEEGSELPGSQLPTYTTASHCILGRGAAWGTPRSELDRPSSRAAAQEAASPIVSPHGSCEKEVVAVPRHGSIL